MLITALQYDVAWMDPQANFKRLEQMIDRHPGADLYVLPEMFTTGFVMDPERLASIDADALEWLRGRSAATGAALCGSVAVNDGGRWYNRMYFVKPDGTVTHYDKHHLFTFAGEHERYTAGKDRAVVEWGGVRFFLQVCYDLRFPVFSRNHGDYDVALYVANWPERRRRAWDILLPARAVENQCYVVGVNRVGNDPQCTYDGGTVIIDPYGRTVAHCEDNSEGACTAPIDMDRLKAFRTKFPVLNDAD